MKLNYTAICTDCGNEQNVKLTLCEKFALKFLKDKLIYRHCEFCHEDNEKELFEIIGG